MSASPILSTIFSTWSRLNRKGRKLKFLRKAPDSEITRIYQGSLAVSGIKNPLLTYVLSPILNIYWKLIRSLI